MFGTNAWRVGSLGGIEIRIDPSWSIIAFLIGYTFSVIQIAAFPDEPVAAMIGIAVAMTAVFFASVLLHELAHSWTARARGVAVHGITLFLFGGATQADLDTESPEDELTIAAVGPVTSLIIAGTFWVVAMMSGSGPIGYAAGHLGWINLALAVFNLVPGFPLDGGRILRSILWRSSGSVVQATRTAAKAGQVVGYLLIGLGLVQLFAGGLIGGLWLMAIGWFLSQSAQAAYQQLVTRRVLADVSASHVMSRDLVFVPGDISIEQAVDDYFMRFDHSAFPVGDGDHPAGIVTLRAVRRVPREEWGERTVRQIAEPMSDACTVSVADRMDDVFNKLVGEEAQRVVVRDDGRVVGIITPRDVARWVERSRELGLAEMPGG